MDNFSHSLVGLAVGELVQRSLAPEPQSAQQQTRRRMLLVACGAASNVPDLDLLLKSLLPDPLGYLLLHRGHTHTLLFAVPQGVLLATLLWLLWPAARRLLAASAAARRGLALAITLGLLLHLAMDFLNSYGIHPFYPIDPHWLFGDMVFIVEPVFWIATGVPLALMVRSRPMRWSLLALLAGVPLWSAYTGFLHAGSLALLATVALIAGMLQLRAPGNGRAGLLAGLATCLAFVGMQAIASARGVATLAAQLHQRAPASELVDASMTAYPANPLCWNFVAVERNEAAGVYRLRRGVLSVAPAVLAVDHCPAGLAGAIDRRAASPAIAILSNDAANLSALRRLARDNCYFRDWLRFARTPLVRGDVASDVRFGTPLAPNFSTIDLAQFTGRACPLNVP
ncbi:MAG: metal-dependent hydrolase, partial [Pseudomonadota bacterium]|nr:metal-dependent hydrolase [Pseudomonadota bacterium]